MFLYSKNHNDLETKQEKKMLLLNHFLDIWLLDANEKI